MHMLISDYLHAALEKSSIQKVIKKMQKQILESGIVFDAIACSGNSGTLIAPS